jgi:2-polyprenyl-3-methyl-5-hydroxy-6-metoxy-1,4-benzoquinol methylase
MQSSCLFCPSESASPSYYPAIEFNDKVFHYITCDQCKLVYINPLLSDDDLKKLYSIDYHNEFYFNEGKQYKRQREILKKHKPKGRLLDYGCGDASFLRYFQNDDYELFGAEYNPVLVEQLKAVNKGIDFITIGSLLSDSTAKYDIIHLGDVLEHLVNPKEIIRTLRERLAPGGVLFVEGPIEHNFNFAYIFLAGNFKVKKMLMPKRVVPMRPFHIFFSNRENQRKFFERNAFDTLHYEVFEWAWPLPDKWSSSRSVKQKLEFLIGKISTTASSVFKGWGNRFYYVGSGSSLHNSKEL